MSDVDPGPPKEEPDCGYCCDTGCVECDPTVEGPELPAPPLPYVGESPF